MCSFVMQRKKNKNKFSVCSFKVKTNNLSFRLEPFLLFVLKIKYQKQFVQQNTKFLLTGTSISTLSGPVCCVTQFMLSITLTTSSIYLLQNYKAIFHFRNENR